VRPCIIENHVTQIASDKKNYYPTLYNYWLQKLHNSQRTHVKTHIIQATSTYSSVM